MWLPHRHTDRQTDAGQIDPYVPLCFTGIFPRQGLNHAPLIQPLPFALHNSCDTTKRYWCVGSIYMTNASSQEAYSQNLERRKMRHKTVAGRLSTVNWSEICTQRMLLTDIRVNTYTSHLQSINRSDKQKFICRLKESRSVNSFVKESLYLKPIERPTDHCLVRVLSQINQNLRHFCLCNNIKKYIYCGSQIFAIIVNVDLDTCFVNTGHLKLRYGQREISTINPTNFVLSPFNLFTKTAELRTTVTFESYDIIVLCD